MPRIKTAQKEGRTILCGAQARHIHGTAIAVDGGGTPGYY
jgi:hypothetical protein